MFFILTWWDAHEPANTSSHSPMSQNWIFDIRWSQMKLSNILFKLCHSMKALTCWKTEILQSMTISASWRKWWKKTISEAISLPTEENKRINLKGIFPVQVLFLLCFFLVSGARRVWLLNWRPLPYIDHAYRRTSDSFFLFFFVFLLRFALLIFVLIFLSGFLFSMLPKLTRCITTTWGLDGNNS